MCVCVCVIRTWLSLSQFVFVFNNQTTPFNMATKSSWFTMAIPEFVYVVRRQIHYNDIIMGAMASQITSLTIVYSTVYSGAGQRKHQNSASMAFLRWFHRWPVNSRYKWPVTRKKFPFDDVIMWKFTIRCPNYSGSSWLISWLLMSWFLASPGYQCPWYWLCRIGKFLSYKRKDFNYQLCQQISTMSCQYGGIMKIVDTFSCFLWKI